MTFTPNFWRTHVGSVPHKDSKALTERLITMLDVPSWAQMPRRTFRENMYVQYSSQLPRVQLDDEAEKITFDTSGDMTADLEKFYEKYLAEDIDAFALTPEYAAGFHTFLEAVKAVPGEWIKGQVTGPISFGLTVTDQDLRASLYNEMLADVIVKNTAMIARWQIRQLRAIRPNVIIFIDEPYMASFGSAFISLSREQVITMLNEVFEAIHDENALAGVHCCANTDWSVLLETSANILNVDAYGFMDNLALYPVEMKAFMDRGGAVAWGIIPNNEQAEQTTPEKLAQRLRDGFKNIATKAQARNIDLPESRFSGRSLITPACGLGSASVDIADKVYKTLERTGEILQQA